MSLLRRIESARPAVEEKPAIDSMPSGPSPATIPPDNGNSQQPSQGRMLAQVPLRESFREAKFRIQARVISELDPKLDLANQIQVRREIEEVFGRALEEEGLALTRAERTRMLEQITD